jgi:hypothetical protein
MKKDKDDFRDLWTLSNLEDKITYHENIDFELVEDELVIFDEADEYIYEDPKAFLEFISEHMCVCLTATSGGQNQEAAEKTILGHIGLKVFDLVETWEYDLS